MSHTAIILLVILVVLLFGAFPVFPHSQGWGYTPASILGAVLILVIVLALLGKL